MPNHAEQLQQAKDAIVEAAHKWYAAMNKKYHDFGDAELHLMYVVIKHQDLLAATCQKCGGAGRIGRWNTTPYMADPCPAKCDNGRKRDE